MNSNKNRTISASEPFVRRHRAFFVGLFVAAPLITIMALLAFTILKDDVLQKWCVLHAVYDNSHGLKNGNQVTMSGITIGYVKKVDLIKEKEVCVRFDIRGSYNHLVKKDTRARLKQKGFVGDWEIELTGGGADIAVVQDGDTLLPEHAQTIDWAIEAAVRTLDTAAVFLSQLNMITGEINDGKGSAGQFLKDDSLYNYVRQISKNAAAVMAGARKITSDAGRAVNNVNSLVLDVNRAVNDVNAGGMTLIDTLMTVIVTLKSSLGDVEYIMKNFKSASDEAPELMDRLQNDIGQAELMMRSLQKNWFFKGLTGGEPPNPNLTDKP